MSFEVTTSFVQQYKDNVVQLSQQKGSRFRSQVRQEPDIVGLNYYFERIGATAATVKIARHSPTPLISTPHSRRRVAMTTYNWGDLIDNDDKLKLLIDPQSQYVIAATNAFGRIVDDIIVAGALGSAAAGADGATSVTLPSTGGPGTNGQYIPDTAINNDSTLDTGTTDGGHMSPQRVRLVKQLFDQSDVDPDIDRSALVPPTAIAAMLTHVQVTSADYNTVKALAEGAVDTYMGFKFIMSNRIPIVGTPSALNQTYAAIGSVSTNGDRLSIFVCRNGVGLGIQEDPMTRIAERPDMNFATQVYMEMVMGAVRIEEAQVIVAPTVDL